MDLTARRLRTRAHEAFVVVGVLLVLVGLLAVGLEEISFGHSHLAPAHAVHHHHFFLGEHQHSGVQTDHAHHDSGDSEAPAPPERKAPRQTVTVAAAPAVFQPVSPSELPAPVAAPVSVGPAPELPLVIRPLPRPTSPRGPPVVMTAPGVRRESGEKGTPRCRA